MNRPLALSFALGLALAGCAASPADDATVQRAALGSTPPSAVSIDWPVPEGWAPETFIFPLSFAPELPYVGIEHLRFAPGFSDPSSPTYFSYSFVWMLEGSTKWSSEQLAQDFRVYFSGLARTFDSAHFDPAAHSATFAPPKYGHLHGIIHTVDPFNGSPTVVLNTDVETVACGDRQLLIVTLSPHATDDATWAELIAQRRTLRCVQ